MKKKELPLLLAGTLCITTKGNLVALVEDQKYIVSYYDGEAGEFLNKTTCKDNQTALEYAKKYSDCSIYTKIEVSIPQVRMNSKIIPIARENLRVLNLSEIKLMVNCLQSELFHNGDVFIE